MSIPNATAVARLSVPPAVRSLLASPSIPLLLVADERDAAAAGTHRLPCLMVSGGEVGPDTLDELGAVVWAGRRVFLIGAAGVLAEVLAAAGAVVRAARLPDGPDGRPQSVADFLTRHGRDALWQWLTEEEVVAAPAPAAGEGKGPSVTDRLVALAGGQAELWHDPAGAAFASVGRRAVPVRGRAFRHWLTGRFRAANDGRVPPADALAAAAHAVEAEAVLDGPEQEAHVRVAEHGGRVYLHLADADDTVIEIDAAGWRECPDPPVRFRRAPGALPLPRPEPGGSLDDLRTLLDLDDRDRFALLVGFLAAALTPGRPQPVLVMNGEQGSGKTTAARGLKALLDPAAAPVRAEPTQVRDLMIAARHNHLLAVDNLSRLPAWLSDAVCRLATGGGFATRELFTDDGEVIFDARRPVVLNGIDEFVTRGDLLERAVLLRLPAIPEDKRVPEAEFWERFHALRPTLLGALLDRVAGGLRELPGVRLGRLPRMADFARWGVACERGAGEPERFLAAYLANQAAAHEQALDGSSVAGAVVALMAGRDEWEGTPTELLSALATHAPDPTPRDWPKAACVLTGTMQRLAPHLRRVHRLLFVTDRASDITRRRVVRLHRRLDDPLDDLGRGSSGVGAGDFKGLDDLDDLDDPAGR